MHKDKKRRLHIGIQVSFAIFVALVIIGALVFVTQGREMPVLNPQGTIAHQERDLILITTGLGMLIVIPVFIMLSVIAWRYRASNKKAKYQPQFDSHRGLEAVWWGVPVLFIIVLAVITVISTHALDPYKPLDSKVKPVSVQVIAMDWKWLFIYPEQNIATVNYLNIPKETPINFTITSDAPMNAFWIPALAGQVYAMAGMSTKLHVMADGVGTYSGVSSNISGDGFADMRFKVHSMNESDFASWAKEVSSSANELSAAGYERLSVPSRDNQQAEYVLVDKNLYNRAIMKYMYPSGEMSN